MAVTQKAPLGGTFGDRISWPAWANKPSWYQISSEDRMIHPDNQRMISTRMNARKVVTLPASHASLASRPVGVAALIHEAATELAR
jgi:pimeloyl-ACP methyl ester carboxylesterase